MMMMIVQQKILLLLSIDEDDEKCHKLMERLLCLRGARTSSNIETLRDVDLIGVLA